MVKYKSGEAFIDCLYKELINSEEVKKAIERRGINPKSREEAIRYYMERMEQAHSTSRKIDILKRFYYRKYVIDHLPESYVELQWRIAREQGYGNVRITDDMKEEMLEDIQSEQRKSLDMWIEYLNDENAMYPMWFKYYAFQGMLKLGQFDKEKREFSRRTKDTASPFIEVNPEILGQMYTILSKLIGKEELTEEELTEEELKALESGDSFQRLYTSLLSQMEEKIAAGAKVLESAGGYSPTLGIIGAVLGLIQVMQNLSDPSKLGAGIAVAFVATIYGLFAANLVMIPLGTRIKFIYQDVFLYKNMIIEGVLSIQAGESPVLIERKLQSFIIDNKGAEK